MDKQNYFDGFDCWSSVTGNFEIKMLEPGYVWAKYETGCYDGQALVIYKIDDTWYQVNASHCSCYGLEDQFHPEILDVKLHLEAVKEGKSLIDNFVGTDGLNEWLEANL